MDCMYDTEFLDRDGHLELISVGIVSTTGRELYLVNSEMDREAVEASPWLVENVLRHLPPETEPVWQDRATIVREVAEFLEAESTDGPARLWAWNGAHDKVVVANLWPSLLQAPKSLKFTYELKQLWIHLGRPDLPEQSGEAHDALEDSRYNLEVFEILAAQAQEKGIPLH